MSTLEDLKTNAEIKEKVNEMFKRVENIKKIRRKRKIKRWLGRHLN
jgi:hypothetical protein